IALFPVDDDVAVETEISDNIIASSTVVGIYLNGANPTVVRDNRIGIGSGGTHLPNRIGLKIENTKTSVIHNTIAYNSFLGVEIAESNSEDTPVLMESNSIFNNGDAGTNEDRGIFYTSPPTVNRLVVATKFDPVTGRETHFFAVPAFELATGVTIEVFANSNLTNPQGETPLFRLPMTDGEDFFHRLDIDSGSELAGSSGFRATATYGGVSTSQFFPVTKQFGFEEPELTFLPSAPGFVKLGWPSDPNFKLQTKEKLNQSWVDVAEPVVTQGNLDTVTVPLSDAESVFFQLSIDVEAMLSE
ncbi:MAG: right-handed parallel beta-helix repeat-containing protein, partial [Verrucomicrobiae bacterium]|nr:right-handed parallel beta-helix repeat-containing protein [Verrucomicrobiae bacterium]